jgi:hypothetical protein
MDQPVYAAFSSNNLDAVAREFREKFPGRPILIAADNDHEKEGKVNISTGQVMKNVGLEAANAAAQNNGAAILVPPFTKDDVGCSDWNDYAHRHGDVAARKEILRGMVEAQMTLAIDRAQAEEPDPKRQAATHSLMHSALAGNSEARAEAVEALVAGVNTANQPISVVAEKVSEKAVAAVEAAENDGVDADAWEKTHRDMLALGGHRAEVHDKSTEAAAENSDAPGTRNPNSVIGKMLQKRQGEKKAGHKQNDPKPTRRRGSAGAEI